MKIAVFSTKSYDQHYFDNYNPEYNFEFSYFETPLNPDTAKLTHGFDVVCVFVNDIVDAQTIKLIAEHGVGLIALRCAGYNNVDVEAAKRHNVKVVRVPAYSPEAVAEHAMALILTVNRKTHKAYNRVREGNFSLRSLIGFNLHNKTVGVIGTGQIGAAFCNIVKGFGCKIVAYDIKENPAVLALGATYMHLDELFAQADIISLHCPLNKYTRHMISEVSVPKMKDGVMIINTSRGALIDTTDVIDGLISKKIGYLAIDVYEQEENLFFEDHSESIIQDEEIIRLMAFPNVLITSHQAFFTREAMDEITTTTLDNIKAYAKGEVLKNEVK